MDGFVIDRIQTGGVNSVNVQTTKIAETGNYETVGLVRDIPDLSFEIQSLDVSTDIESLVSGSSPSTVVIQNLGAGATPVGNALSFLQTQPVDVTSPFRAANARFNITQGVIVPCLYLEQVQYRYGLKANAEETFTMRGDAIYYCPGLPVKETAAGGSASYSFTNGPAFVYHELGQTIYAVSVWWFDPVSGLTQRLFHQQDYTDTNAGFTLVGGAGVIPSTATVHFCYASTITGSGSTSAPFYYGQNLNTPQSVKPAAIRSKDMDVYLGVGGVMERLTGVQSFDATWKVNLDLDEEFGNAHYTSSSFNFADVNGSVALKGVNPSDVITKVQNLLGVPTSEIVGALTYPAVELEVRLRNPVTHQLLKTIYIPDAEFVAPPIQAQQNTNLSMTLNFDSATGQLLVFDGERLGGEV